MVFDNYQRLYPIAEKLLQPKQELWSITEALSSFMAKFQRDTNVDELEVYFLSLHPGIDSKGKDVYHAIFQNIAHSEVAGDVADSLLRSLQIRQRLTDLAIAAYESAQSGTEIDKVTDLARQVGDPSQELEEAFSFVTDDLDEIYSKTVKEQGLRWRLKSLNQALGSLRKGDFGFVFARPETGKTTFLASECTHMASQTTGPILWFNNEEQGEKVMLRCYQAALGASLEQLFSSISKAKEQYYKITGGRIKIVDAVSLGRREADDICRSIQPALVVFDQIDKVTGFAEDRDDLKLGAIYQWARQLAKQYCPVVGICQADGSAEGVKWLTMSHVSNAKTSKQAEADWILGIGKTNEVGYESVRHFNVSKNKLVGDVDSLPDMRHGRWDVLIEPQIARYKDIL